MSSSKRTHSIIIMAFITCFLDSMNYALIVPILPYLVKELNSTSMQEGLLFSSYSVFQLISRTEIRSVTSRHASDGSSE